MWKVTRKDSKCIKGCKEIADKLNDGRDTNKSATRILNIFTWDFQPEDWRYWTGKDVDFKIKWTEE